MATNETLSARQIAFDVLRGITEKKEPLDVALLSSQHELQNLDERDRAFARHLVTTCLRHLPYLDTLIDGAMDTNLERKNLGTRNWLRLGITQVLFMNVENHAAVHTTVELMGKSPTKGIRAKKGLANAILRRFAKTAEDILLKRQKLKSPNIFPWLKELWLEQYGEETVQSIANALLSEPPLDLTIKDKNNTTTLATSMGGEVLGKQTIRLTRGGDITKLQGFDEGLWWVQDLAASIPANLFGDVNDQKIADLCAAPGGKTMQLASMGAKVTAVDVSKKRLVRLEENLNRTGLKADVVTSNVLKWQPDEMFDGILLDAPCTATGTLRRRPDVPIHKSVDDVKRLNEVQTSLLAHAFKYLKPDGVLVYCTCSMEQDEGERVVNNFLSNTTNAQRVKVGFDELKEMSSLPKTAINVDGDVRTTPDMMSEIGGIDGFFICRIKKDSV